MRIYIEAARSADADKVRVSAVIGRERIGKYPGPAGRSERVYEGTRRSVLF